MFVRGNVTLDLSHMSIITLVGCNFFQYGKEIVRCDRVRIYRYFLVADRQLCMYSTRIAEKRAISDFSFGVKNRS